MVPKPEQDDTGSVSRRLSSTTLAPVAAPEPHCRPRRRPGAPSSRPVGSPGARSPTRAGSGEAALAAALAELGMTYRTAWYTAAVLYGVGGFAVLILYPIDPALLPLGIFYLGLVSVVIGGLCLWGARAVAASSRWQEPLIHARLGVGLAIYVAAAVILGRAANAFALFPLLTIPSTCYLYSWRFAVPYSTAAAAIVFIGMVVTAPVVALGHAIVSTVALLLVAWFVLLSKERTRRLAERNRLLAYTDPLTGIANRRSLRERISAQLARPAPAGGRPALFAIDLDNFKEINDRFDHAMGDRVLCAVAAALAGELSPGELVARRGGDEFAVLLPNTAGRDLGALRERLAAAIWRARMATCPAVVPSGAVAYVRARPGEDLAGVMLRADEALRRAKRRRRALQAALPADVKAPRGRRASDAPALAVVGAAPGPNGSHRGAAGGADAPVAERGLAHLLCALWARAASTSAWGSAVLIFGVVATAIAVVSLGGLVEPLSPAAGTGFAAGVAAAALACGWAGAAGRQERWLHLPWAIGLGLVAGAVAEAGIAGTALLDLLPAIVLCGFLIFNARVAALYMIVIQALYGVLAITGGFEGAVARTAVTASIVAIVGGLLAKLRLITVDFARTNEELSEVDELTGVANLRALRRAVDDVVERAAGEQARPLLVALDLDGFKQVNDRHSHSTGDEMLVAVARAVSECVQIEDLVARRGGDEFVVLAHHATPGHAEELLRRIDRSVVQAREGICPDLPATASIAPVRWRPGETAEELLLQADVALHRKKAALRAVAPRLRAS